MASINEIKKKIKSVKSTRQITKAMKMISGMRLIKAQKRFKDSSAYLASLDGFFEMLSASVDSSALLDEESRFSKLINGSKTGKEIVVVIAGDRGLCGGFNNSVISRAVKYVRTNEKNIAGIILAGKKSVEACRKYNCEIIGRFNDAGKNETALEVSNLVLSKYLKDNLSKVVVISNTFISMISFKTQEHQILPFDVSGLKEKRNVKKISFEVEPSLGALLEKAVKMKVEAFIAKAFAESYYAELATRVSAMDNATRNATSFIESLTLEMNKVRQANITTELADIIGSTQG